MRCLAHIGSLVAGLFALALPGLTPAAPVSIDYASITATSVEDFEDFIVTDPGVSFLEVLGFSVSSAGGINVFGVPEFCGQAGERCLYGLAPRASLVLDGFEHGVTAVGFIVSKVDEGDVLRLTATGGSGAASFLLPTSGAYAISDPHGLGALVFGNEGAASGSASIYGLDKVVVGRTVPAPPTALILIGGLVFWQRFAVHDMVKKSLPGTPQTTPAGLAQRFVELVPRAPLRPFLARTLAKLERPADAWARTTLPH